MAAIVQLVNTGKQQKSLKTEWFSGERASVGDAGVFIVSKDRQGNDYTEQLSVYPLMPVAVFRVKRDGQTEEYVKLQYRTTSGEVVQNTIEASELATLSKARLPGFAAAATGAKNQKLGYAVALIMEEKRRGGTLEIIEGTDATGWDASGDYITADSEQYAGSAPVCYSAEGNASEWFKTASEMVTDSPLANIAMAAAIGGFIRGNLFTPDCSHIVSIYGERMKGKSTIARLCASISGDPEKGAGVFFDAISTRVGTEVLLSASNNAFICLDEADEIFRSRPQPVTDLMFFCNGGGRIKGNRTGGASAQSGWNETIITTSNQPLLQLAQATDKDGTKAEALSTRIIELDILDEQLHTFTDPDKIYQWDATIANNYGHAFPAIIQKIRSMRSELKQQADDCFVMLLNEFGFAEHHRHAKLLTTIFIGQEIMASLFEEYAEEIKEINYDAFKLLHSKLIGGETKEEKDESLKAEFMQWIADNCRRFRWDGFAFSELGEGDSEQLTRAENLTAAALEGSMGVYGLIKNPSVMTTPTDFSGLVILNQTGRKALEKQIPVGELVNLAKRDGWIVTGEGRNDAKKYGGAIVEQIGSSRALTFRFNK